MSPPVLALTQGDPAGIGPEILLKVVSGDLDGPWRPLLIAERAALESLRSILPDAPWEHLSYVEAMPSAATLPAPPAIPVLDPVGKERPVSFGLPRAEDAAAALAALDAGLELTRHGIAAALVTAPVGKAVIAEHLDPSFRGHTDYLAAACGCLRYGHDYLMAFLAADLQVALLTTHLSLRQALTAVRRENILDALRCLHRHVRGRIAVAGLNPHAGEGGLMGSEEEDDVRPAVEQARREGIDAHGPESADSLFARARQGEFDWVLALYHDQGLIPVKTTAFGTATNWTLGLPILRTSVDHGTAYGIAGRGIADAAPLREVIATTLRLLDSPR